MIRSFIYQTRAKPGPDLNQLLLNGGILPIGGASLVEGLQSTGLPRLISYESASVNSIISELS